MWLACADTRETQLRSVHVVHNANVASYADDETGVWALT